MYWLTAPPYLRWAGAALLLLAAFVVELRPAETALHPFAATAIEAGTVVTADLVEFRLVPAGLLPRVELPLRTTRRLAAGEPLLAGAEDPAAAAPPGWWAVELSLPAGVAPGAPVQVVVVPDREGLPPRTVEGIVEAAARPEDGIGRVALPGEEAAAVAAAAAEGRAMVLVRPGQPG